MDAELLFLAHLIPKEMYEEVCNSSINNMQEAANALQWRLLEGLGFHINKEIDVINILPIASYPKYYKKMFINHSSFNTPFTRKNVNVGFCNLKLIRKVSIAHYLYVAIKKWCDKNPTKKIIFVYSLNASMLKAIKKIKKKYSDVLVCSIVADLPNMMSLSSNKSLIRRCSERIVSNLTYKYMESIDRFVLLTKQMTDYLNISKPYCVMEGIASNDFEDIDYENNDDLEVKTILYTGTLHRKFGILNLLKAFEYITDKDYRLLICGAGDCEGEIQRAASRDSRIIYKGQVNRSEALRLQKKATLLVNPRMNNEEFTKYSFPSKNLEYLSSGTPLIAYKLDGIPDEYDKYITYVEGNEPYKLTEKILEIGSMSEQERKQMGYLSQQFVLEKKNTIVQTKKIIELVQ